MIGWELPRGLPGLYLDAEQPAGRLAPGFDRWVGFRIDGLAAVMRAMH